jgi:DNA repair ATPase RecN
VILQHRFKSTPGAESRTFLGGLIDREDSVCDCLRVFCEQLTNVEFRPTLCAVSGAAGSGKTTLAHAVGQFRPEHVSIYFDHRDSQAHAHLKPLFAPDNVLSLTVTLNASTPMQDSTDAIDTCLSSRLLFEYERDFIWLSVLFACGFH